MEQSFPVRRLVFFRGAPAICLALLAATARAQPAPDWAPEVQEVLQLYRSGDYAAAQQLCLARMETARDVRVKRDAAALYALTLLRMPARSDRLDGRGRLAQLGSEDPTLPERPECRLGLGVAQMVLAETSAALDLVDKAATGFEAQKQPERLAEALASLAEGWSCHSEWETTPARFRIPPPRSSEQARAVRRERMGQVRDRLAVLPGSDDALARVDLLLARDFIAAGDRVADGLRVLEQVATAPRATPSVAAALLELARFHEQQQHWTEALALYQRLAATGTGPPAREAEQRAAEISQAQIVLDVPASAPARDSVRLALRVRNLAEVRIEVRRVELPAWLESHQGRLLEAQLPESGSVQFSRRLDTKVDTPHAWWQSDVLTEPLELRPGPGAYVVSAGPLSESAAPAKIKRLLLVSDLAAAAFVGSQHVLVWAAGRSPASSEAEAPTAWFWMHGSFTPTTPRFEAGVARFPLPPEARVFRDKRWVCLVRAGEHLALCQGELPASTTTATSVLLVGGPSQPRVGETLHLVGLIRTSPDASSASWRVELRDTFEHTLWAGAVGPSRAGAFGARIPLTPDFGGQYVHAVVRRGDQVVENLRGRFGMQVLPADVPELEMTCRLPPAPTPPAPEIPVQIQAWYPWGTPLAGADVSYAAHGVGLAALEAAGAPSAVAPISAHGLLDERGMARFDVPVHLWELPGSPQALAVRSNVAGWEGQQRSAIAETLLGTDPVCAWLRCDPVAPTRGEPVRFSLGWYDPTGRTGIERPVLELRRSSEIVGRLRWHADADGLRSEPWRPESEGTYEVAVTLPRVEAASTVIRRTVEVGPSRGVDRAVACTARLTYRDGQPAVHVHLEGQASLPVLALVATHDPLAARALPGISGPMDVFIPVGRASGDLRLTLAALGSAGTEVLCEQPVEPEADAALTLHLAPPAGPLLPGNTATVRASCARATGAGGDVTLIARLIPASDSGYLRWLPGESRSWQDAPAGRLVMSSATTQPAGAAETRARPPAALAEALYEGATLWTDVQMTSGAEAEFAVPLPGAPDLYRLVALALAEGGATAVESTLLDTRRGLRVRADTPPAMIVGDRTVAAVLLAHERPASADVRVRLDVGDNLHVESISVNDKRVRLASLAPTAELPVTVPAQGRVWITLWTEAVRPGIGTLTVEVNTPDGSQKTHRNFEVLPVGTSSAGGPTLRVKRTLLLLSEDQERVDPVTEDVSDRGVLKTVWRHSILPSNFPLVPGQQLLVREEFQLDGQLPRLTWRQRVPANCHARQTESQAQQTVGVMQERRLDALRFQASTLPAGPHTHEYHIVAVRPGVCLLSLPDVEADGRPIRVIVDPPELLLRVARPAE